MEIKPLQDAVTFSVANLAQYSTQDAVAVLAGCLTGLLELEVGERGGNPKDTIRIEGAYRAIVIEPEITHDLPSTSQKPDDTGANMA
jgi:hypothetical protein